MACSHDVLVDKDAIVSRSHQPQLAIDKTRDTSEPFTGGILQVRSLTLAPWSAEMLSAVKVPVQANNVTGGRSFPSEMRAFESPDACRAVGVLPSNPERAAAANRWQGTSHQRRHLRVVIVLRDCAII